MRRVGMPASSRPRILAPAAATCSDSNDPHREVLSATQRSASGPHHRADRYCHLRRWRIHQFTAQSFHRMTFSFGDTWLFTPALQNSAFTPAGRRSCSRGGGAASCGNARGSSRGAARRGPAGVHIGVQPVGGEPGAVLAVAARHAPCFPEHPPRVRVAVPADGGRLCLLPVPPPLQLRGRCGAKSQAGTRHMAQSNRSRFQL